MSLMTLTTVTMITGSFAIVAAAIFGVARALRRAGWEPARASRAVALVATVLVGWLAAGYALAWNGAWAAAADRPPTIELGILLPILAGVWLYRRSELVRDIVAAVPQSWLIGIQVYRTLGFTFLAVYAAKLMPGVFALPAGTGDVIVGLTAGLIAWVYGERGTPPAAVVRLWNGFGIADLVVAVTTGFMSSPSALQLVAFDLPNQLISEFPLALVPTFAVPLAILLHFASLAKVGSTQENGAKLARA